MEIKKVGAPPYLRPWPTGEQYDLELLEHGDTRNVEDRYRYWKVEAIKADLAARAFEIEIAIENWQHDFNIGTIVRNANAFNVKKVHIIGKKQWNRRGAMVTDVYLTIEHHATVDDFISAVGNSSIVAIDNIQGSKSLTEVELPKRAVLVFGSEGPGISAELLSHATTLVKIPQFGSTRSVNVGVASGIVLYKWIETHIIK